MLDIEAVDQFYGSSHTLRNISMEVRQGECLALLGRNGVGKTTLLKCLMGLLPIAAGRIRLDGENISRLAPHQRAALGMAYVPQGREIFPRLTVRENMLMGMARFRSAKARRVADDIYDLFPVLKDMLARRGGDLSGGQQQQLAIARALASEPRLIIFDEPTEGIQPSVIKDIRDAIQTLKQRGDITILLCEQYFEFACELADRFVVLNRGAVAASGGHAEMNSEVVRRLLAV